MLAPEPRPPDPEPAPTGLVRLWRALTTPAPGLTQPEERRRAQLQAGLLLLSSVFLIYAAIATALSAPPDARSISALLTGAALVLAAAYGLSRTARYVRAGRLIGLIVQAGLPFGVIWLRGLLDAAALGQAATWITLSLLSASLFVSARGIALLAAAHLAGLLVIPLLVPAITYSDLPLLLGLVGLAAGAVLLDRRYREGRERDREAEHQQLTRRMEAHQARLEARSRDAERRSAQLAAAAEVGRAATSILSPEPLLAQAVELIQERFGFDHVAIYLLDEARKQLVLREAAGEGGKRLKAEGQTWPVGGGSAIGRAAADRQASLLTEPGDQALLPDMRSAAVAPLCAGERLIGVLHVQSRASAALTSGDLEALQILADQLAVAVENGRLFARQQRLLQLEQLVRSLTVKIHQTVEIETIVENAAAELGRALGAHRAVVRLHAAAPVEPPAPGTDGPALRPPP